MESGQSSHNNGDSMQLMSLDFSSNNLVENDGSDHRIRIPQMMNLMENGKSAYQLPWWVQHQEAIPHDSYIKFLLESSASALAADHSTVLTGIPLPGAQTSYDLSGTWPWNHYLGRSPSSEADAWRLRLLMQQSEDLGYQFSTTIDQPQNQSSWRQNASYTYNVPQVGTPSVSVASAVHSLSPAESRGSKPKPNTNDRKRRNRIHENLNALQELLPNSAEGYQGSVLDDVIDHVKFLQLKIKDLSKTRLESESPTVPVIFREGYGHYLCDQGVLSEPLEEVMGKLLEQNPTRAMQLLEMKGLLLLPIEYTQGLW